MRRQHHTAQRRRRHAPLWPALLFALAGTAFALFWYVEERFEPILNELAEYEASAAVTRAVNAAVAAELADHPQRYARLYSVRYSGTALAAVQADAAALNEARLALLAAVNGALADLPPVDMTVPFGTLTDLSLLNELGPGWPLSFTPQAFADGRIRESTETVAISAARYTAVLELTVTINMVLDGKNRVLYAQSTVPLASVVAGGETPLYYAAGP